MWHEVHSGVAGFFCARRTEASGGSTQGGPCLGSCHTAVGHRRLRCAPLGARAARPPDCTEFGGRTPLSAQTAATDGTLVVAQGRGAGLNVLGRLAAASICAIAKC